jgi:hypothetical protein
MTIVIYKHDYINFEGEKTYLVISFDLIDKFWPSKWEKIKIVAMKNGTFNYSPKHSKIGEEENINTLILKYNLNFWIYIIFIN